MPIAVVAILAAIPLLRESKAEGDTRYDVPGALLVTTGLASLVYGFFRAESGWGSWDTVTFLALGVVLLAVFVRVEARVSHPLLPLRLVTDRSRTGAYLTRCWSARRCSEPCSTSPSTSRSCWA